MYENTLNYTCIVVRNITNYQIVFVLYHIKDIIISLYIHNKNVWRLSILFNAYIIFDVPSKIFFEKKNYLCDAILK